MKNLLLIFSLFTFFIFYSCEGEQNKELPEAIRPIRISKVIKSGDVGDKTFSGAAQASKQANLSFKVAGTILDFHCKVGDRVPKGHTIALLDATDYSVQLEQAVAQSKSAETQIKSAETQLITSKSTYERIEKLYENNSVPLSEYENAKGAYEAAKSQFEATKAQSTASNKQAQAAQNQVGYANLRAPFAGVITMVNVEENELVNSGTPIAVLTSESDPEVSVGVPGIFINKIKKGQNVHIQFSVLDNTTFDGTVSEIAFSSGQASTYPVTIKIKNPSSEIRPGMAAKVRFSLGDNNDKEKLIAPAKAIGEDAKGKFVFVVVQSNENYSVKRRSIKIGNLTQGGFEIKEGLKEGEMVATAGLKSLLDGMKVRPLE
ncbi:MAG: efflux RND transporter periplasmic adaptor subunit [Saprospiraceae bacterium]|jgi:RND family efflux transporter MFP subunit|nr:efflux RND transporter periplasmic adaptor subunit [Saprospiraceae bacterium]